MKVRTASKHFLVKVLLIIVGTLSLIIGIIGVIVPLLPTTPFIILTAGCYVRSSDKLDQKLKQSRLYKNTIKRIRDDGMTTKDKLIILIPVWIFLLSMFFMIDSIIMKIVAIFLGTVKTIVFYFIGRKKIDIVQHKTNKIKEL